MAEVHGVAGEWARVKGTVFGLWPLFCCVFFAGVALTSAFAVGLAFGTIAFALAVVACAFAFMHALRRVERSFKGARGEERVAEILKGLPASYHVFNDFVAGTSHVDHVVVGPAGVFAIETKFWSGEVTIEDGHILVDGQLPDRAPLAQALREAALVKAELACRGWEGDVTPVLTFASNTFKPHIAEINRAVIINARDLSNAFATPRVVLPQPELDRLVALMENN